jgi:hypothetical protein
MGDLRGELEQITAQFVATVLEVARRAPLHELLAEVSGGRRITTARTDHSNERASASASMPTPLPRGVRGAPTALKRAIEWQRQLEAGEIRSRAAIARREGLTRARVTQIMNMLRKKKR